MNRLFSAFTFSIAAALSVGANAAEVELLEEFNITMSRYGMEWRTESYTVAVDNLAFDKSVFIHREKDDGTWVDLPMYYHGPAGNGKEIWKLTSSREDFGDEFVVKMVTSTGEYWDSNFGNNYSIQSAGYLIGNSKEVTVASTNVNPAGPGQSNVSAVIVLDNVGVSKNVELVYSLDNWATSTVVNANYLGNPVQYGYGSYPNPSANNAEAWRASFSISEGTHAQFFVKYTVNGVAYYDSNYGADYQVNPPTTYPAMTVRVGPYFQAGQPMSAIAENLWSGDLMVTQGEPLEFKFDVHGDWAVNFGDNNHDGIAELNGNNIEFSGDGQYRVFFNDATQAYWLQPFGDTHAVE